ncbi:rhamnogalacturonan acetylesterase [Pelagicoccus albus]|uniref:Rhamnogalacturonan acetylesterase n=1 Tax=Pelagicoccus albus TaxID=415222 RepID=A0A7X1E767_9BACT|nr:rhamnogalacturonan acetylesterase [Pelagicoccus albus]MBC2605014.1 rhamnogalacturonan acetylesterase [Pelagicoccus albus]
MRKTTLALSSLLIASACYGSSSLSLDFGTDSPQTGFEQIASTESLEVLFSDQASMKADCLEISGQFIMALPVEEGNYNVTLHLKPTAESEIFSLKAESRRLLLNQAPQSSTQDFQYTVTLNTHRTSLKSGGEVQLKSREVDTWLWNDKLELEFTSEHLLLDAIEITPAPLVPTLHIIGDSTVADQSSEPWTGWGQIFPVFLKPGIAVVNHSSSGFAFSSFKGMQRFEKVLDTLHPGDVVIIQFGHNDQKEKGEGIGPWESYTNYIHEFVSAIRAKGGRPVLVTSMKRRNFDSEGRLTETLGDYPKAVRQAAKYLQVPLIDLNYMSGAFYSALGPKDSKNAFVHYPAGSYPEQEKDLADNTHFNPYGGHQLARCIVEGLKLAAPELDSFWVEGLGEYDPGSPDSFDSVQIPASPISTATKPYGN